MMSPLVTGWLTGCRNFDRNWWLHFSRPINSHSISSSTGIRSFSRWLFIHRCHNLTLQNEKTTTTCEFNSRTVESAQNLFTSFDERFDASVHQPRDTQNWSLHINDCEAHSKFFALTPEVYGPRIVVFQQLTSRGLERGTWPIRQRSVCEVVRPTDMLGRRSTPPWTAQFQLKTNQEVKV